MDRVIIYPKDTAVGGISIVTPIERGRAVLVLKEAVYKAAYQIVMVDTGEIDPETNEPVLEEQQVPADPILVEPEERRMETDDEFLSRIAAKDIPLGTPYRIVTAAAAAALREAGNVSFDEPDGLGEQVHAG